MDSNLNTQNKTITIAHSPDADDAFMFYGLSNGLIDTAGLPVEHILKDIQTLNLEAKDDLYDVQAISFNAYPELQNEFQLLSCGGSLGIGYGPSLVSKENLTKDDLNKEKKKIAIPGEKTTAYLLLQLYLDDFEPVFVPFDQIIDTVVKGECEVGLLIHEGQLSYSNHGLNKIVDLGEWWLHLTNLPVPLGANIIRRRYDSDLKSRINSYIRKSIVYGLENKDEVIPKVSSYARELDGDFKLVDKFVTMYVNQYTVEYGNVGERAIKTLYQRAIQKGIFSEMPNLDFVL